MFDHGIGEQLGAHRVEIGVGHIVGDLKLDEASRAHVADARKAQSFQRMMDRFALRVEHPRFERHMDLDFHGSAFVLKGRKRWARLCPRITRAARGGSRYNRLPRIANQSQLYYWHTLALSLNGSCCDGFAYGRL